MQLKSHKFNNKLIVNFKIMKLVNNYKIMRYFIFIYLFSLLKIKISKIIKIKVRVNNSIIINIRIIMNLKIKKITNKHKKMIF